MPLPNDDETTPVDPRLPTTPRKREAEEWALVLTAEGFDVRVVRGPDGFGLHLRHDHAGPGDSPRASTQGAEGAANAETEAAREILTAWQAERRERAARVPAAVPAGPTPLETAVSYACALTLLAFHLGLERAGRWQAFVDLGDSQAALVLHGQLWRLVTALTLHADLPHVLGNTLFGGFFLAALAGRLGVGLGLLTFVVSGSLGNLANAVYYGSAHSSIGASTGVFGLVGVLAGLAAWKRHRDAPPGRGAWVAFGAGLAIVAMLGSGGPRVDFAAHLFGLAAGGLTGLALAWPLALAPRPRLVGQWACGVSAALGVLGAWQLALSA